MRFERQVQGAFGIVFFGGLRLRGEQHGAAAVGGRALDVAVLAGDADGLQRTGPIVVAALQVEQAIDRPGELRVERDGAFGKVAGGISLMLALRFEEEAAQTQLLGVGRTQHGFENAAGRRAVTGELRGLRPQKVRQRLVGQRLARLDG